MADGFEWGGKFWGPGDQSTFANWLKQRGASYSTWAGNHPTAAGIFGGVQSAAPAATAAGGSTPASPLGVSQMPWIDYGEILQIPSELASLSANGIQDAGQRRAALQQAMIAYGQVPDFAAAGFSGDALGYLNQDIDQRTRDLAQKNTDEGLSIFARLQKANKDNERMIKNSLGARGMVKSGESAHLIGEEALRYKQGRTDATNNLTQYMSGTINQFVNAERARTQEAARLKALQAAIDRMTASQRQASATPAAQPSSSGPGYLWQGGPENTPANNAQYTNYLVDEAIKSGQQAPNHRYMEQLNDARLMPPPAGYSGSVAYWLDANGNRRNTPYG